MWVAWRWAVYHAAISSQRIFKSIVFHVVTKFELIATVKQLGCYVYHTHTHTYIELSANGIHYRISRKIYSKRNFVCFHIFASLKWSISDLARRGWGCTFANHKFRQRVAWYRRGDVSTYLSPSAHQGVNNAAINDKVTLARRISAPRCRNNASI